MVLRLVITLQRAAVQSVRYDQPKRPISESGRSVSEWTKVRRCGTTEG